MIRNIFTQKRLAKWWSAP